MWRLAGRYSAVGIEIATAFTLGALGGHWLDKKLGTSPVLFLVGITVGTGAAVRAILRVIKDIKKNNDLR